MTCEPCSEADEWMSASLASRSLQVRSFITQDDGTYHFSGLKGDIEYQLTAKAGDGSAGPKTLSIFDSRKEAILNFKLEKK